MTNELVCPECGSPHLMFSRKRQVHICEDCDHTFVGDAEVRHRRVFISYGHDEHAALAERLRQDLEARGHEVWFDLERLKPGADWERRIEEGLAWIAADPAVGRIVLLMTPHSVRRPDGYCLNEIARAVDRKLSVVPIMVVWCEPPLSICRIQWLDMRDCVPLDQQEARYEARLERLAEALEHDRLDFEGAQARLSKILDPLPFEADIAQHLPRFTGRQWVFDSIDAWLSDPDAPRVFWLVGKPGVGKTAIAAWLCNRRREIAAFHLCRHGHAQKSDPRRCVLSIAYQLSSQLPEYESRLTALNLEDVVAESNAQTLFDVLIAQPLSGNFARPDRTIVALIDALDEATQGGRNELAAFLASEFEKTPEWLRLIITSRPDPEVTHPLQRLTPYVLDTEAPENEADIRAYLARELQPFARQEHVPPGVVDAIAARSEGVFLYVDWVRAELAQGRLSLERVEEFPQGLGGVYARFFERQLPDISNFTARVRPVLEVIVAAQEPAQLRMMARMFDWGEYEGPEIRRSLGSLFTVADGGIEPFHHSLTGWLTDPDRAGPYYVSVRAGHERLADYGWEQYQQGVDGMSAYALRYLSRHLIEAERRRDLEVLLTDLAFIEAKCRSDMTYDLIRDYDAIGAGRTIAMPGAPVVTARQWEGAVGIACPFCGNACEVAGADEGPRVAPGTELDCPDCQSRRRLGPAIVEAEWHPTPPTSGAGLSVARLPASGPSSPALDEFADFVRSQAHTLYEYPELTLQQAHNEPDASAPSVAARRAMDSGSSVRPWVRWISKRQQRDPCLATLLGHADAVTGCAYSPDGRWIASTSKDKTVRLWDAGTGALVATLEGHYQAVTACVFSPDGRLLVSTSEDQTLMVWDTEAGRPLATPKGHTDWVYGCDVSPDGSRIISVGGDNSVRVWDIGSGDLLGTLYPHTDRATCCAYSRDGRAFVSGSADRLLKVRDAATGVRTATLDGHRDRVAACDWSPDGRRIVSGSWDGTLGIWDAETGEETVRVEGHTDRVTSCRHSPTGEYISSGAMDNTLRIWEAQSGAPITTVHAHSLAVNACCWSPDGRRIVSASSDRTLKIWDVDVLGEAHREPESQTPITVCALAPDGRRAASGSSSGALAVWDAEGGGEVRSISAHSARIRACAYSPAGDHIATGSTDKSVRVWDAATGEQVFALEGHRLPVSVCAYSPCGGRLISASAEGVLKLWDTATGTEVNSFQGHRGFVNTCTLSPDGRLFVTGGSDRTLKVWDTATAGHRATLEGHSGWVAQCAYAPDATRVVSASMDGTLKLWDTGLWSEVATLQGHSASVSTCAFSPDGCRIVSGSLDNTLRLWDVVGGAELGVLEGHSGPITACGFGPEGRRIVSAAADGTLRVWDGDTGSRLAMFSLGAPVSCAALAGNGRTLALGSDTGNVYLTSLEGFDFGTPIVTAARLYRAASNAFDQHLTARCAWCGQRFTPPQSAVEALTSAVRGAGGRPGGSAPGAPPQAGDGAGPRCECPHCGGALRVNSFIPLTDPRP